MIHRESQRTQSGKPPTSCSRMQPDPGELSFWSPTGCAGTLYYLLNRFLGVPLTRRILNRYVHPQPTSQAHLGSGLSTCPDRAGDCWPGPL